MTWWMIPRCAGVKRPDGKWYGGAISLLCFAGISCRVRFQSGGTGIARRRNSLRAGSTRFSRKGSVMAEQCAYGPSLREGKRGWAKNDNAAPLRRASDARRIAMPAAGGCFMRAAQGASSDVGMHKPYLRGACHCSPAVLERQSVAALRFTRMQKVLHNIIMRSSAKRHFRMAFTALARDSAYRRAENQR